MHAVEPPEQRHAVEDHVLEVNGEIEHHDRGRDLEPARQGEVVEQADAAGLAPERDADRHGREEQAQHEGVEHHDADVVRPAPRAADLLRPARRKKAPQPGRREAPGKAGKPNQGLVRDDGLRHGPRRPQMAPKSPWRPTPAAKRLAPATPPLAAPPAEGSPPPPKPPAT